MKNKEELELEEIELAEQEALEDAELRGFKKGVKYINTEGDEFIAEIDPIVFIDHEGRTKDVHLHCGDGQGLIKDGEYKTWGRVIK